MSANILAVDDSPTMRVLLSRSLESMGYRVTSAVDGQDALDKYAGAAPMPPSPTSTCRSSTGLA